MAIRYDRDHFTTSVLISGMVEKSIALLAAFVISVISQMGYAGIILLMGIESACIPLPSEIILPFSGYLVFQGQMNLWLVSLAGALGSVLGSLLAYYLGFFGGRHLVERYGRYLLISKHDLAMADYWFDRYGDLTILFGRMLPVIRTFIALPAGIVRMDMKRFIIYTFVGSFLWCLALAELGFKLGQNWRSLGPYFHQLDTLVAFLLIVGAGFYVYRHLRKSRD